MASPEHGVRKKGDAHLYSVQGALGEAIPGKGNTVSGTKVGNRAAWLFDKFSPTIRSKGGPTEPRMAPSMLRWQIGRETMHELSTRLTEGGGCFTSKREEPVMPLTRCIWVFFRLKDLVYGSLGQDQSCVLSVTAAFIPSVTGARNNPSLILGLINHLAATVPTSFPWIKTELKMRKPTLTPLDHFNEIQHSNMHGEMKSMHILSKLRCRPV
ncbi:hypothetical protein H105_07998 [Trichophyton soudanense CBS 452.61]|uniref:Uncharacterized protein n=1 Tax=Trichophyton soudanense CBS 452.61 TaxID=1215331 RepID=A0A022XFU0_TRISD|nr:hypothetical protein H105_07998 [Trichophyton soudanense CBS 452.61]